MSLGTLHIVPLLNEPIKVHYGPEDPIRGNISVRYTTSKLKERANAELFGPLKIRLRLTGTITESGRTSSLNDIKICSKQDIIQDGPVRLMPGSLTQYPFAITFPEHADPKVNTAVSAEQQENGQWRFEKRTTSVTTEPLPPSMRSTEREGVVKRELGIHYVLDVVAEMPGFGVEIVHPYLGKEILYDQPRIPASAIQMMGDRTGRSQQTLTVQDDALIEEAARPQGFRGKAKAMLKHEELPKYIFGVTFADVPKHVFVGQPLELSVSVATDSSQSTITSFPSVSLHSAMASLIAQTTVPRSSFDTQDLITGTETLKSKEADIIPSGPFHKSHDHTKTISLGTLSYIPSTFSYADTVSRSYKLRLSLSFLVAGQTVTCMRQFDIEVHPPLLTDGVDGGEQPPSFEAANEEDLPSYDEVVAGPSTNYSLDASQPRGVQGPDR